MIWCNLAEKQKRRKVDSWDGVSAGTKGFTAQKTHIIWTECQFHFVWDFDVVYHDTWSQPNHPVVLLHDSSKTWRRGRIRHDAVVFLLEKENVQGWDELPNTLEEGPRAQLIKANNYLPHSRLTGSSLQYEVERRQQQNKELLLVVVVGAVADVVIAAWTVCWRQHECYCHCSLKC